MPLANSTSSQAARSELAGNLIDFIYALILAVTVGSWIFVGFVVWIPLLIRTTVLLAAAVLYATLFGDQKRVSNAERSVHLAARFYLRGFEHFLTFYRHCHDGQQTGLLEPLTEMKWRELVVECLWVIVVWSAFYFVTHGVIRALSSAF